MPDLSSYKRNRDALYNGLTQIGYRCVPPDGAFYLFVQAPNGDGDAFAELAKSEEILIVSGREFGCPDYVRISYCVSYETIVTRCPVFGGYLHKCAITDIIFLSLMPPVLSRFTPAGLGGKNVCVRRIKRPISQTLPRRQSSRARTGQDSAGAGNAVRAHREDIASARA